ncbi:CAP domain-containing protein [Cellulosimicrobium cellulans]|uniref:CAP domain-containing protein n=1 Tax=Cellulosimicrobium cellulans TaxID=1710 RepID=UPI0036477AD2
MTTLVSLSLGGCALGDDGGRGAPSADDPSATLPWEPTEYAARLLAETQEERDEAGVPRLEESGCATEEALSRATALVGVPLEHAPLDEVVAACAPPRGTAAENLSRSSAEPAAVVDAWMGSHGHRANLLDPTLTSVGVACVGDATDGAGGLVCAQVFLG